MKFEQEPNNPAVDQLLEVGKDDKIIDRSEVEKFLEKTGGMERLLGQFTEKGYLLHGTNKLVTTLEPRTPKTAKEKVGETPENEQNAVYAGNTPILSLGIALLRNKLRENAIESAKNSEEAARLGQDEKGLYLTKPIESPLTEGYVYVLDPNDFEPSDPNDPSGGQFVSYAPIEPLLVIPVIASDLGSEIRIKDKDDK